MDPTRVHSEINGLRLVVKHHAFVDSDERRWLRGAELAALLVLGLPISLWSLGFMWAWEVSPWVLVGASCLGLILFLALRVARRRAKDRPGTRSITCECNAGAPDARLQCYGEPAEIKALREVTPRCVEPVIVRGSSWCVVYRRRVSIAQLIDWVLAATILSLGVVCAMRFGLRTVTLVVVLSALPVCAILARVCPVYLRVTPGKLEILDAPFWRLRVRRVESVDLLRSHIVCDYSRQRVDIGQAERLDGADITVRLNAVREPHRFVRALFHGAISEWETRDLPNDQLLG